MVIAAQSMRILMVSSEVETFARTGGLGDAVLGLARALAKLGHDVCVVTPRYGNTTMPGPVHWWFGKIPVRVGWGPADEVDLGVGEARLEVGPGTLRVCLLEDPFLFGNRRGIYEDEAGTFGDNERRFAVLSRGALEVAARLWPDGVDVIHAHDWHAALAVIYARTVMGDAWARVHSVFTIHNLAYQGVLGFEALDRLGIPRGLFHWQCLEHDGHVNLMKGAIALASVVTTVSPTYAREIRRRQTGFYLDWFLRMHSQKLIGITNGLDEERLDPRTDTRIARQYGAEDVWNGKWACKQALQREMDLEPGGAPLFGCVSRLTDQKGVDLLDAALPVLIDRGASVVLVGKGDARLEDMQRRAALRYPGRVATRIGFDPDLAQRAYSGCDFIVMPSRFEPCGLTQLYAMRFGAVPVVTDVGGLHDTVEQANLARGTGTGFVAGAPTLVDLVVALEDALGAFLAHNAFQGLRQRAMRRDSSWTTSARTYLARAYA